MTYPTAASADERRASRFFPRRMRGLGAALFVAAALMVVAASATAAKSSISVAGFATVDGRAVVGEKVARSRPYAEARAARVAERGACVVHGSVHAPDGYGDGIVHLRSRACDDFDARAVPARLATGR